MTRQFQVVLSYPVSEKILGLGTVNTTRCERTYHDTYNDAYDHYKTQRARLHGLGLLAQCDLVDEWGNVQDTRTNMLDTTAPAP